MNAGDTLTNELIIYFYWNAAKGLGNKENKSSAKFPVP